MSRSARAAVPGLGGSSAGRGSDDQAAYPHGPKAYGETVRTSERVGLVAPHITIANRVIGGEAACFIVAEVGVNHDGDVAMAHRLVDVAADSGADAVKFQTFDPPRLVSSAAEAAPYQRERGADTQLEMLRRLSLPDTAWKELAAHATERGLVFLSTAFDDVSLERVLELGVPALKVPSGELTNLPFIRTLAAKGLPLIISTGLATLEEVGSAVAAADGADGICLLHCVTAYPAPVESSNLRAIETMRARFGLPVGWSDHTQGWLTAVGAVALGASVLEKHITTDRGFRGPDHEASEDPAAFEAYVRNVRAAEAALGNGVKRPVEAELPNRAAARRSYHARRDLRPGEVLRSEDVELLRPATGLAPDVQVAGRSVLRPVAAGAPLRLEDLE